jgi:hypothetical protein
VSTTPEDSLHAVSGHYDELDMFYREVWGEQDFGSSEIAIRLVMKVVPAQQWAVEREMRRRLKDAFDKEGIEIPFPQRTVWHRYEDGQPPEEPRRGDGSARRTGAGEGQWGPPSRSWEERS